MPGTSLPKPTNKAVSVLGVVLEFLIEGLGADLAYGAAVAQVPFLGSPIIRIFVKGSIDWLADYINTQGFRFAAIMTIRFQNDIRKQEYDKAIEPIKKGKPSAEQIAAAKAAIDRIVYRSK